MKLAAFFLLAATLRGPADVETLTRASDAVVHARVVRRESAWGAGGPGSGVIYSRVTLAPLAFWKGAPSEVVVRVPGGAVGELEQTVQGVAQFAEGEEVVVFLRRLAPGLYDVHRWALGKFSVEGTRASRDRRGITCVGCRDGEEDALDLAGLRSRVRGSLSR